MAIVSIDPVRKEKMNITDAAEYLGAHPETLRKWIRQGKIPAHRIGERGTYFLYEDELAKAVNSVA